MWIIQKTFYDNLRILHKGWFLFFRYLWLGCWTILFVFSSYFFWWSWLFIDWFLNFHGILSDYFTWIIFPISYNWYIVRRSLYIIRKYQQIGTNALPNLTILTIHLRPKDLIILNLWTLHNNSLEQLMNFHKNNPIRTIQQLEQNISS